MVAIRTSFSRNDEFQPSAYQQTIFDWIARGSGDGIVIAVAGSGKTTTLVQAARRLSTSRALFAAFNKAIADKLKEQIGGQMACRTIHSLGNGCLYKELGSTQVEQYKYNELARKYAETIHSVLNNQYEQASTERSRNRATVSAPQEPPKLGQIKDILKQLVHYVQHTLTDPRDRAGMTKLVTHHGIEVTSAQLMELYVPAIEDVLAEGEDMARDQKVISYEDMLYLPHVWNLSPAKFDWVFVDEAQDLSKAKLDLVLKARARGGRMLFVGDPQQSIYGFTGADVESFWKIKEQTNAQEMPLSICYRCPQKVLDLARRIVPEIEAQPDAPEGKLGAIDVDQFFGMVREGDLILCRMTSPLIELCIQLITQRIPAKVRGRDIGKSLTSIVREVAQVDGFSFSQFLAFLDHYQHEKVTSLQQQENAEAQIESLGDRCNGLRACYHSFAKSSVEQFCRDIENLFSDDKPAVMLSTVHRAKGLEEDRVFILKPDALPLQRERQRDWEWQQEVCLTYVAITRAKQALYLIANENENATITFSTFVSRLDAL